MHKKKLRILFITGLFHPHVGGTERQCNSLARELKRLGHEVLVFTQYQESLPAYEQIDGIPVYRCIKGWHLFELTYMMSVFGLLIKHRKDFDGIVCFGLYLFTAPAVVFSVLWRRKVFFRLESSKKTGDFFRIAKLKWKKFILACTKLADGAIAITTEIEQELIQRGFPPQKIHRIPNAVDTQTFFPARECRDNTMQAICYVGRLEEEKGLNTLLLALQKLKKRYSSFQVTIVGDGKEKSHLRETARVLQVDELITFVGEVASTAAYYQRSHVLVYPSHSEGMPLSVLEAMACGTVVVASRVGGMMDIIRTKEKQPPEYGGYVIGENGILFPPGNAHALAGALARAMEDSKLQSKLADRALEDIKNTYALEKVARQYIDLFTL